MSEDPTTHYMRATGRLNREVTDLQATLARLTEILNQDGGWCSHGVLMDRAYHPRCSNCVLNQAREELARVEQRRVEAAAGGANG